MAALFSYQQNVQRLIHDQTQMLVNPESLAIYINEARREVAMRSQCLRLLTTISGQVMSITVDAGGSGYSPTPTVTISAPDFPAGTSPYPDGAQATVGTVTVVAGVITAITVDFGGAGYFQPVITIEDTTGSGASASAVMTPFNATIGSQEVYNFRDIDLSPYPGFSSIYMVRGVSIIYANYRYSLPMYSFTTYQAMIRQYPFQYQYVPTIGAQFGQGSGGSFYLYPLPSTQYQMEWDCLCLPQDLEDDQSVEALEWPWIDAVQYFAAFKAFLELQNPNQARMHLDIFESFIKRYNTYSRPGRATNPYGRW